MCTKYVAIVIKITFATKAFLGTWVLYEFHPQYNFKLESTYDLYYVERLCRKLYYNFGSWLNIKFVKNQMHGRYPY